ncbi:uncharacterized protein B0P05DRAFT_584175 [Gilbertella persicaria]|uniref:Zn(2)-C6 fungal-type domain-containing protein n=1 Tax=Rhizopus stolonifer TaxID=4846 RepID=A0A367IVE6_RHIST|nr:uncharacterized protein B0P05DRAFT_584175 [Gilbertella persicaria]KAI8091053.1 hypothetical protein B0P05DRAFT_584175 [Gilbertella persicaria]RCH81451.1 hypothetical protein CU098_004014 [Rhizopus stolonifer]
MDTTYSYPQLFDIDDTFDTELLHGLQLQDHAAPLSTLSSPSNNNLYNVVDKKSIYQSEDVYNSLAASSNSYLQYLQNTNNYTHDYLYGSSQYQLMNMTPNNAPTDLVDYDYLHPHSFALDQQKQQYNWLYDPIDTFLPSQPFCEDIIQPLDSTMQDNNQFNENVTVEGGMSRGYVSLSDVNSFVAKADSAKHSCAFQLPESLLLNDFALTSQLRGDFLSSPESNNDDSEDDYSDSNSDHDIHWPIMTTSASYSSASSSLSKKSNCPREKLMIKIKKPDHHAISAPNCSMSSALSSPYNHSSWDLISPKSSKSTDYRPAKYRKSMSNIYNLKRNSKASVKYESTPPSTKYRRGSAPHRLNTLQSSSSLSTLSSNLQRSMHVSDSVNSFMSRHSLSDEDNHHEDESLDDHHHHHHHMQEEDDDDDGEYQIRPASASHPLPTKKGRNVDKACNHCKRSHLRCDDMRPCRRCVATGKTGCKDVQHKPRGRPKLHKK